MGMVRAIWRSDRLSWMRFRPRAAITAQKCGNCINKAQTGHGLAVSCLCYKKRCCTVGAIFDVAVDLRRSSATFGQWVGAELSDDNKQQLWVPVGFAHGFLTLSETAEVLYKASGFWSKTCERSLRWNDPQLAIAWPLDRLDGAEPLLAEKDAAAASFAEAVAAGEVFA
jgi:dTDP-4-dehydrorhamnose 3,5-epimerase-like enzyme